MSEYLTTESPEMDWHHTVKDPVPPPGEGWKLAAATFRPTFSQAVSGYDGGGRWREDFRTEVTGRMVWVWSRGEAVQS